MIKCEFSDQRYRDRIYLSFTLAAAALLSLAPLSSHLEVGMQIEMMYWMIRVIQVNKMGISSRFCHVQTLTLLASFYICLHDLFSPAPSLRIILLDLLCISQVIIEDQSKKKRVERETLSGKRPFDVDSLRPNRSYLEYFFSFKSDKTKKLE